MEDVFSALSFGRAEKRAAALLTPQVWPRLELDVHDVRLVFFQSDAGEGRHLLYDTDLHGASKMGWKRQKRSMLNRSVILRVLCTCALVVKRDSDTSSDTSSDPKPLSHFQSQTSTPTRRTR